MYITPGSTFQNQSTSYFVEYDIDLPMNRYSNLITNHNNIATNQAHKLFHLLIALLSPGKVALTNPVENHQ